MDYRDERDAAIEAAQQAGRLIRTRAGTVTAGDVREKRRNDLVTETDEEAQWLIESVLADAFPAHEMLAEEGASIEAADPVADGYRWIVDPIDGTTNFTFDAPPYAVSIALQHEADLVVGVVLDVAADVLYTAVRGAGAFRNGVPMRVAVPDALRRSLIATGFPFRMLDDVDAHYRAAYMEVVGDFVEATRGVRRFGSAAIDLALLADGRFTGFFETGLSPWDVAAGIVLIEEAGGRVSDFRGRPDVLFTGQIVASNGPIHDEMLEIVRPLRDLR